MRREEAEQVELLRRQPHLVAGLRHLAVSASIVRSANSRRSSRLGRARAPEDRAHARGELARRERLRHVVVGAELEPDDAVGLLAAGGEHDHRELREGRGSSGRPRARRGRAASDRARPGPAAPTRASSHAPLTVAGLERPVAVAAQVADDDLAHDRLVVHDQDGLHRVIVTSGYFQSLKSAFVANRSAARKEPERPRP